MSAPTNTLSAETAHRIVAQLARAYAPEMVATRVGVSLEVVRAVRRAYGPNLADLADASAKFVWPPPTRPRPTVHPTLAHLDDLVAAALAVPELEAELEAVTAATDVLRAALAAHRKAAEAARERATLRASLQALEVERDAVLARLGELEEATA